MISIRNLYDINFLPIYETLVDKMFDFVDRHKLINDISTKKEIIDFKNEMKQFFDIEFEIHYVLIKVPFGEFIRPNKIIINVPKDEAFQSNVSLGDIVRIFLHELSHYFTDQKIPEYYEKKNIDNFGKPTIEHLYLRLKNPPSKSIPWNNPDIDLLKQFLDYIYQPRELANFALMFALSIADDEELHQKNITTSDIFDDNDIIIKKYLLKELSINALLEWYGGFSKKDMQLFFQIHYFSKYLKSSYYFKKLIQLKNLIEKYRRRVLLYYIKQNTKYRSEVFIFNKDNKICFGKSDNGSLIIPGGEIEYNQTPEETAIREAMEEVGIKPRQLYKIDTYKIDLTKFDKLPPWIEKFTKLYCYCFKAKFDKVQKIRTKNQEDVYEPIWLTIDEAIQKFNEMKLIKTDPYKQARINRDLETLNKLKTSI